MINVTIRRFEPKEKKFPKLMINRSGEVILALSLNEKRSDLIVGVLIKSEGLAINGSGYAEIYNSDEFSDYNEPITIQND